LHAFDGQGDAPPSPSNRYLFPVAGTLRVPSRWKLKRIQIPRFGFSIERQAHGSDLRKKPKPAARPEPIPLWLLIPASMHG
jgi:hypothetical protein